VCIKFQKLHKIYAEGVVKKIRDILEMLKKSKKRDQTDINTRILVHKANNNSTYKPDQCTMAPVVKILNKDDVGEAAQKRGVLNLDECPLKELVQYECEVVADTSSPTTATKYECTPFRRLFRECLNGKLRIEVTDETTN